MMSEQPPVTNIEEQAAWWFARLRAEDASSADHRAHADWLLADPAHQQVWDDLQALWQSFEHLTPAAPAQKPRHRPAAAMLSILLLGTLGLSFWLNMPNGFSGLLAEYKTERNETRQLQLPDGSRVTLDAASAMSLQFTRDARHVRLHYGNAFFDLQDGDRRPLIVETDAGQITDIGTRFNVQSRKGQDTVMVAEGIVDVHIRDGQHARLHAGEAAHYHAHGLARATVDPLDVAAWQQGVQVFRGTPLRVVLDELEARRGGRILLSPGVAADAPVDARFRQRSADEMLTHIAASHHLDIVRLSSKLILLRPQDH